MKEIAPVLPGGIPLTLDSLFDCAMIKRYFVVAKTTLYN